MENFDWDLVDDFSVRILIYSKDDFENFKLRLPSLYKQRIDEYGGIALGAYSKYGDLPMVKFLIGEGVSPTYDCNAPLRKASGRGHIDVIEYLLECDPLLCHNERLSLERAVKHGSIPVVKCLIEHGHDVNAHWGLAVNMAATYNNVEALLILLKHGADVNLNGGTALRLAVEEGHYDIVKILLDHGYSGDLEKAIDISRRNHRKDIEDLIMSYTSHDDKI